MFVVLVLLLTSDRICCLQEWHVCRADRLHQGDP